GLFNNLMKNSYIGCTMAFKRSVLERALPFPKDTPMHDWWIGLVAELFGTTYFCSQKLTAYRRHESNASASAGKSPYTFMQKILLRYVMAKNLALRWLLS
ncbi:glycosyltransferase family 2 protein, partial [bacterium]|nr:glycosyltransferase family 2 protein [bacterium]